MYVGAQLRVFFEDAKPALLQQIDAVFEKVCSVMYIRTYVRTYVHIHTPLVHYNEKLRLEVKSPPSLSLPSSLLCSLFSSFASADVYVHIYVTHFCIRM